MDNLSFQDAKKPLLVGTYGQEETNQSCQESLKELSRLMETLDIHEFHAHACPLRQHLAATYLGSGKIQELIHEADKHQCDFIVIDDELSPSQQRNLEKEFHRPVVDRTEIILEVFFRHAHSKEAKLQVEVARIRYQLPRLKRLWTHLSRQKGGGTQARGEGEKQIELDKRQLRKRLDQLQVDLKEVQKTRSLQRQARERSGIVSFAIVGYTNAGKSTLLKALTEADVLVADKLFATLDTTTRHYRLPNNQEILIVDTVGFIRKLPHTLVAAFRSTLQEAVKADILLHLIDISSPEAEIQAEATLSVLKELGAEGKPMITIFNKSDQLHDQMIFNRLRLKFPRAVLISSLTHEGFDALLEKMEEAFQGRLERLWLRIPQSSYAVVAEIERRARILEKTFEDNDIILLAELPRELLESLSRYKIRSEAAL